MTLLATRAARGAQARSRGGARLALAGLCWLLTSCAPSLDARFLRARSAAERAYSSGRYDEAAQHWREAAESANRDKDRHEARYRRATALARAGHRQEAIAALATLATAEPRGARAPRALYDEALLLRGAGQNVRAQALLDRVLSTYPESGAAQQALRQRLMEVEAQGPAALRAYVGGMQPRLAETSLDEALRYALARLLEREGRLDEARRSYAAMAARHPYPQGALWDDALWRAASLDERLGEPQRAIQRLRFMLEHVESSQLQGSYRRPRYAQAQFHIAELYRDALGDPARARREFERVWTEHGTSLLRDDAEWQAAKLAAAMGDPEGACRALEVLVRALPESRFVACAPRLCSRLRAPAASRCHAYLMRDPAMSGAAPRQPAQ